MSDGCVFEFAHSDRTTKHETGARSWALLYHDAFTRTWSYIEDDSDGVTDGLLAEWDTTSLTPGHYTLRLRATDRAKVGCGNDPSELSFHLLAKTHASTVLDDETISSGGYKTLPYKGLILS